MVSLKVGSVGAVVLGGVAVVCVYFGETELAGVAIGAIATWLLKNGVNKT